MSTFHTSITHKYWNISLWLQLIFFLPSSRNFLSDLQHICNLSVPRIIINNKSYHYIFFNTAGDVQANISIQKASSNSNFVEKPQNDKETILRELSKTYLRPMPLLNMLIIH